MSEHHDQEPHDIDKTPLAWFVAPAIAMGLTGLWGWAGLIADRDRAWPQLVDSLAASATVAVVAVAAYLLQRRGQRVNRRQILATRSLVDQIAAALAGERSAVEATGCLAAKVEQLTAVNRELVARVAGEDRNRLLAMLDDGPDGWDAKDRRSSVTQLRSTS